MVSSVGGFAISSDGYFIFTVDGVKCNVLGIKASPYFTIAQIIYDLVL